MPWQHYVRACACLYTLWQKTSIRCYEVAIITKSNEVLAQLLNTEGEEETVFWLTEHYAPWVYFWMCCRLQYKVLACPYAWNVLKDLILLHESTSFISLCLCYTNSLSTCLLSSLVILSPFYRWRTNWRVLKDLDSLVNCDPLDHMQWHRKCYEELYKNWYKCVGNYCHKKKTW
jgi:hypothetical protein